MPYIKKEDRPQYDRIQKLVNDGKIVVAVAELHHTLVDLNERYITGHMNYLFTQAYRKSEPVKITDVTVFIDAFFDITFWDGVYRNYRRFELVCGLLNCMINEFKRRKFNNWNLVVTELQSLLKRNETLLNEYEDRKIQQNSDLD